MFKRLIEWFKGAQEPSSPDETSPVEADENAAPPSGTPLPKSWVFRMDRGGDTQGESHLQNSGKTDTTERYVSPKSWVFHMDKGESQLKVNLISKTVGK